MEDVSPQTDNFKLHSSSSNIFEGWWQGM